MNPTSIAAPNQTNGKPDYQQFKTPDGLPQDPSASATIFLLLWQRRLAFLGPNVKEQMFSNLKDLFEQYERVSS